MTPDGWTPNPLLKYCQIADSQDPFVTESGEILPDVTLAYETWGQLNADRDNALLVIHALTGDAHAASHPEIQYDRPGWWEPLIGEGRPIDTNKYYVICANSLGSCYGSTGPGSTSPDGTAYRLRFPQLTVRDLVSAQLRLLEKLSIDHLACVIGGSLGGMQALEMTIMQPDLAERAVIVAASGRFHSQGIAFNEIQRRAIMLDPAWDNGNYRSGADPDQGVALARMLGMVTYQSDAGMSRRFDRNVARYHAWPEFQNKYDVEGYLHYQGDKLARRFDANTYLYLSRVMDSHDIGRGRTGYLESAASIRARALFIGVSSDILFPTVHVKNIADAIRTTGGYAKYWELQTDDGHDAFLKNFSYFEDVIREGIGSINETSVYDAVQQEVLAAIED